MARPAACTASKATSTATAAASASPHHGVRAAAKTTTASTTAAATHGTAEDPGFHVMDPAMARSASPCRRGIVHCGTTTWGVPLWLRTSAGSLPVWRARSSGHVTAWPPDRLRHSGGAAASADLGTAPGPPPGAVRLRYSVGDRVFSNTPRGPTRRYGSPE